MYYIFLNYFLCKINLSSLTIFVNCQNQELSVTIKEIAHLAGVSISTVSKIINHKNASISLETRERVLRFVKEFNYAPYSSAIATNAKAFLLGLLICSSSSNRIINGIIEAAPKLIDRNTP